MAAIPTYICLYLIIWDLHDSNFGVYTHVLRIKEYVSNTYFFNGSFQNI